MALRHAVVNEFREKTYHDIRTALCRERVNLVHFPGIDEHKISGGKFVVNSVQINAEMTGQRVEHFDIGMKMRRKYIA